jgi:hypothetical protein
LHEHNTFSLNGVKPWSLDRSDAYGSLLKKYSSMAEVFYSENNPTYYNSRIGYGGHINKPSKNL